MSDNNTQLFEGLLKSMHIHTPFNITMICWRNTSNTVVVSIADMGASADVPPSFASELRQMLKGVPSLNHVSVNTISFFDINDIKRAHIATDQARTPDMCFYVNGTVTINTTSGVF